MGERELTTLHGHPLRSLGAHRHHGTGPVAPGAVGDGHHGPELHTRELRELLGVLLGLCNRLAARLREKWRRVRHLEGDAPHLVGPGVGGGRQDRPAIEISDGDLDHVAHAIEALRLGRQRGSRHRGRRSRAFALRRGFAGLGSTGMGTGGGGG